MANKYPLIIGGVDITGAVLINAVTGETDYYDVGDYIGVGGVESAYETDLRGEKGVSYRIYD